DAEGRGPAARAPAVGTAHRAADAPLLEPQEAAARRARRRLAAPAAYAGDAVARHRREDEPAARSLQRRDQPRRPALGSGANHLDRGPPPIRWLHHDVRDHGRLERWKE